MKFRKALLKTVLDVHAVAGLYVRQDDFDVLIPELRIAARIDSEFSQGDSGDLKVRKLGCDWKVIEIKNYSHTLEDQKGFPNIIIDKVSVYEKRKVIPDYYFVVTGDRTHALYHDHFQYRGTMEVIKIRDKLTGILGDCYVLDTSHWKEIKL